MKQVRIVVRTLVDGEVRYVIQQKHFIFFWKWVDASQNNMFVHDTFLNIEYAKSQLCYFDGSTHSDEVI